MIDNRLWILIKFEHKKTAIWFYSKNHRRRGSLISYFRGLNGFKWGKVYQPRGKVQLYWFNQSTEGETDRQTQKRVFKPTYEKSEKALRYQKRKRKQ